MCLVTGVPCTDEGGLEVILSLGFFFAQLFLNVIQLTQKVTLHLQETFYGGVS